MNYNALRYFVVLAETGQYTQASQRLYISQPSLSYAISGLEKELGVRLFCKNGRRMQLTPGGQRFYASVSQALRMIDGCVDSLQRQEPVIRLCTVPLPDHDLLPQMIQRFAQASFALEQDNPSAVLAKVRAGACDFGVCTYAPSPELCFTPLRSYPFTLIAAPENPLVGQPQVSLRELRACPLVGYPEGSPIFQQCQKTLFAGQSPVFRCTCEDEEALVRLVEQNYGAALMPDYPFLQDRRICRLQTPELQMVHTLYLVYAKKRPRSVLCSLFLNSLCSQDGALSAEK